MYSNIMVPYFEKDISFMFNKEKINFESKTELLEFISDKLSQNEEFTLYSNNSIDREKYNSVLHMVRDNIIVLNINSIRAKRDEDVTRVKLSFSIKGISSFSMILYKYEENSVVVQIILNDNHLFPSYIYKCKEDEIFEKDFYTIFLNRIYKFQQTFLN